MNGPSFFIAVTIRRMAALYHADGRRGKMSAARSEAPRADGRGGGSVKELRRYRPTLSRRAAGPVSRKVDLTPASRQASFAKWEVEMD